MAYDDDEPPLDPAMLRVQARLRRLMLIGGGTLGLGLLAVLGAVIYRINMADVAAPAGEAERRAAVGGPAEPVVAAMARTAAGLSADARLVATALDGDRLALSFADGPVTTVLVVDTASMAIVGRLVIGD